MDDTLVAISVPAEALPWIELLLRILSDPDPRSKEATKLNLEAHARLLDLKSEPRR